MSTIRKQWHDNDWLASFMAVLAIAIGIVGNYIYHGGRLVW